MVRVRQVVGVLAFALSAPGPSAGAVGVVQRDQWTTSGSLGLVIVWPVKAPYHCPVLTRHRRSVLYVTAVRLSWEESDHDGQAAGPGFSGCPGRRGAPPDVSVGGGPEFTVGPRVGNVVGSGVATCAGAALAGTGVSAGNAAVLFVQAARAKLIPR